MARDYNAWVTSVINALLNVVRQSTQQCVSSINQNQTANITGRSGEVVNVGNIDWNQTVTINQGCILSNTTTDALKNNLQQQAHQETQSIVTTLGIDPQSPEAQSITKSINDLATAVASAYQNPCGHMATVSQVVSFDNTLGSVNWTQTQDTVISCISNDNAVQMAKNELIQALNQVSTGNLSEEESSSSHSSSSHSSSSHSSSSHPSSSYVTSSSNVILWLLIIIVILLFLWALYVNRNAISQS